MTKRTASKVPDTPEVARLRSKIRNLESQLEVTRRLQAEWASERREMESAQDDLRRLVVECMPSPLSELLKNYINQETELEDVIDGVIDIATELPPQESRLIPDTPRALCPLCKDGPESRYYHIPEGQLPIVGGYSVPVVGPFGFALPIGLERHLVGYSNFHQCDVMEAAEALFKRERKKRLEGEARERVQAARRAEEEAERAKHRPPRYRLGPGRIDSSVPKNVRQDLRSAEQSLEAMGFEVRVEGDVRCCSRSWGDLVVYADPRSAGSLYFIVYRDAECLHKFWVKDKTGNPAEKLEAKLARIQLAVAGPRETDD